MRRVAANYIKIGERTLINHVVEIIGQRVVNYYPLKGEIAMTEWLGGTIEIVEGGAYHSKNVSTHNWELLIEPED